MQTYSQNRFAFFYFGAYVLIGIYCIMSLVTAVIYNQFKGFFQDSILSSSFRRSLGIRASFWILHNRFASEEYIKYIFLIGVQICFLNCFIFKKT